MTVKNLAASVHARLQNRARVTKRPFQELLQYAREGRVPHVQHQRSLENEARALVLPQF